MKKIIYLVGILFLIENTICSQAIYEWTLEKCIDYAYNQNTTIRNSELTIRRYETSAEQARAQRFPSAGATINHNLIRAKSPDGEFGSMVSTGTNYSVSSGVTLFGASRITYGVKKADLDIQSGLLKLGEIRESVSLGILNAFMQVLYAEEQVNNSKRQIESTMEQVNLATERLNLKAISRTDYAQVMSQLANEKLTLANTESQLAIAKINLMQLMELPVTDSFNIVQPEIPDPLNQNRVPDAMKIYETALSIRPQIKNASVSKEIAALDEKIAKAGYFPTLSFSAGIGVGYSTNYTDTYIGLIGDGVVPSAGFSLTVPIYQKRQIKTNTAFAKISYSEAELREINIRNELRKSIEQACQNLISAQTEYEASLVAYQANLETSMQSDEKFKQGMINSVDYLVSKTNLITAESMLLQSKYKLIFTYKMLDFYSGGPLTL